jgi:hypothetical protein
VGAQIWGIGLTPRLLTPAQARKYLAGADPRDYVRAIGTSAGLRYDRSALDAVLDRVSGLGQVVSSNAVDEADAWIASLSAP